MTRKPEWKQGTPRDQIVALLSALEGEILVARIDAAKMARMSSFLEDAKTILSQMPHGDWCSGGSCKGECGRQDCHDAYQDFLSDHE